MLKKTFLCLLLFSLAAPMMGAETVPTPIPRALPVEKVRKPGLLQRIFGRKPTPAPLPVSTPAPTPKPRKKKPRVTAARTEASPSAIPQPKPLVEDIPDASASATPLPGSLPPLTEPGMVPPSSSETPTVEALPDIPSVNSQAKPKPIPATIRDNPLNQPIPLMDGASAPVSIIPDADPPPEALLEQEEVRRIQFRKVRAKALEDGKLLELKQKSEMAATPAQRLAALKDYYPKLFASMRKLDETLSMEIDEMEAASRRRLERLESEGSTPAN